MVAEDSTYVITYAQHCGSRCRPYLSRSAASMVRDHSRDRSRRKSRAERTASAQRQEEHWRKENGLASDDSEEEEHWRKYIEINGMWRNDPSLLERTLLVADRSATAQKQPAAPGSTIDHVRTCERSRLCSSVPPPTRVSHSR